jgi:2-polyprenyl-3-methyl-5-hydroxy-6-metoxy-1,4-benzoquinol methylase
MVQHDMSGAFMDKSSRTDIPLDDQREMWNRWNAAARERSQGEVSKRQAALVERWLQSLGRRDLELIDVGCGAGWMCERLTPYGRVTGTDLANDVLARARLRLPMVNFIAGDFMTMELADANFDVAVTLEVLSHVADQPAFLARIARLLRPGGWLMLATQNRPVLERWSAVGMPEPGQIRHWVDARTLRSLLRPEFDLVELTSVLPHGDQGYLRLVNSVKLNRALGVVVDPKTIERLKERVLLGHTLMVLARRRVVRTS